MIDEPYPPSPVPSDAFLLPGELPFTAFGQFGEGSLDLRVFEQNVYWVNRFGEPFLLTEISTEYLENILGFIINNVDYFHKCVSMDEKSQLILEMAFGLPGAATGALLLDDLMLTSGGDELAVMKADMTAMEWLESTPLFNKLIEMLRG